MECASFIVVVFMATQRGTVIARYVTKHILQMKQHIH